jgi:hypothetical protein
MVLALAGLPAPDEVAKKMSENASRSESLISGVGATATIVIMLAVFIVIWGYYIICEMVTGGASPGKRALGLRVIRDNGLPINFTNSLLRNLVRIVDFLPWCYGVGLVTMFVSGRSQRLGDLAAGTLVVRIEEDATMPVSSTPAFVGTGRLSPRERQLIVSFFDRQATLAPAARAQILHAIAQPLRARLDPSSTLPDETWLRELLSSELAQGGGPKA